MATMASVESLQVEREALSPKLDPAIMGGIVDGIAGPAAGIYTAVSVAERNAEIDEVRKEASANARLATSNAGSARTRMISKYQQVEAYLKKYSELESLYEEALVAHQAFLNSEKQAEDMIKVVSWVIAGIITIVMALIML